jgi:hypothetical protein
LASVSQNANPCRRKSKKCGKNRAIASSFKTPSKRTHGKHAAETSKAHPARHLAGMPSMAANPETCRSAAAHLGSQAIAFLKRIAHCSHRRRQLLGCWLQTVHHQPTQCSAVAGPQRRD